MGRFWIPNRPPGPLVSLAAWACVAAASASAQLPDDLAERFEERVSTVGAVEFFVEAESERDGATRVGLVLDATGLIILSDDALPDWVGRDDVRDVQIFRPGDGVDGHPGSYLGKHPVSGWHYFAFDEGLPEGFEPVGTYGGATPALGQRIWGIGLRPKEFDFRPYLLTGIYNDAQDMPWTIGMADAPVAAPGAPVFNAEGTFVGWAGNAPSMPYTLSQGEKELKVSLKNRLESFSFLHADEFQRFAPLETREVLTEPKPFSGMVGLQPLSPEAASFLDLEDQGAIVVSAVFAESPADEAGIRARDIIVALDGEPLPKYSPDFVVVRYLKMQTGLREAGEPMKLTLIRERERLDRTVVLGESPMLIREAPRKTYEKAGFTIRAFTAEDALAFREFALDLPGVRVRYVRPNSPAANAGLEPGDWIKAIDGEEIPGFDTAVKRLERAVRVSGKDEVALLIQRGSDTKVLSVKMK